MKQENLESIWIKVALFIFNTYLVNDPLNI